MNDLQTHPLVGSVQNAVGMGFMGMQAVYAVAHALGVRVISVSTAFASAHAGYDGRSTWNADPQHFRKDLAFLISQRPAVIVIGFLPRAHLVDIAVTQLREYKGVVLLDPVIGDYTKGLYVTAETARAIADGLVPLAHLLAPNRFEADVLTGSRGAERSELHVLNALFDLGPKAIVVKSYRRDAERGRTVSLFTNGYNYYRISSPYYPTMPAHGAGDVFAGALAVFTALGASPYAGTLLATTLCARAVANTAAYGGATVDPIAALERWNPLGYHVDDDKAAAFCTRSNVDAQPLPATAHDGPRLKFAPPKHKIVYG